MPAEVTDKEENFNPCIHAIEEGRQLHQWLLTGKVGDIISDVLAQEKALICQIDATEKQIRQHSQVKQHQHLIQRKKAEIEISREALRMINISITEIETALSKA